MIRLCGLLLAALTCAGPVTAQDRWPALFDVSGVDKGDVLNIRAEPDADAAIIGALSPDARDIEVIRVSQGGHWGLVNTAERSGWAALSYLARKPGQIAQSLVAPRRCVGTEPFWNLTISEQAQVTWTEPDREDIWGVIPARYKSPNRRGTEGLTLTLRNDIRGYAVIREGECSDGMSDRAYGLEIDLHLVEHGRVRLLSGCCSVAP